MIKVGKRRTTQAQLFRYAYSLNIEQNGDPSKPVIAAGQTYFVIQTRRPELQDKAKVHVSP